MWANRWIIVCVIMLLAPNALAWTHGSQSLNNVVVLDLNGTGDENDYAFVNFAKSCVNLTSSSNASFPAGLDNNNYPTTAPSSNIFCAETIPPSYAGNYVVKWTGQVGVSGVNAGLQLNFGSASTIISDPGSCVIGSVASSINLGCTSGTVTFTPPSGATGFTLAFLTTGTFSGFTGLQIYRADQAALATACASGTLSSCFNPDFVNIVKATCPVQTNPTCIIRFLNWVNVNGSTVSKHAYRTPTTALTFPGFTNYWPAGAWAGTVSGTNTYTVGNSSDCTNSLDGCAPSSYTNGEMISVYFTNANTGSGPWTVNRNGIGAIPMFGPGALSLSAGSIGAGSNGTLTYVSNLYAYQTSYEGPAYLYNPSGEQTQVPLEYLVAFANLLNANPYFNIPPSYDAASAQSYATYVSANLNSNLTAYFELANEVWNYANDVTTYAAAIGDLYCTTTTPPAHCFGSGEDYHTGYGAMICTLMPAITTGWGSRNAAQLIPVMAVQAAGDATVNGGYQTYRFQGADLASFGCNTSANWPAKLTKFLVYAPYFEGGQIADTDADYSNPIASGLLTAADDFAAGGSGIATALAYVDSDARNGTGTGQPLSAVTPWFSTWNAQAVTFGWKVGWYEGAYQGTYPSAAVCTAQSLNAKYCGSTGEIANMLNASNGYKNNSLFAALVTSYFTDFMGYSNSQSPAWFDLGPDVCTDQWTIYCGTNLYTATPYQSLNAIQSFN